MDEEKFQLASYPRRIWAYFFDAIIAAVLSWPLTSLVIRDVFLGRTIFLPWRLLILQNALFLFYVTGFLMWCGATPGKWLLGIRVVSVHDGEELDFFQALVRALGTMFGTFFGFLPQSVAFFRKDRRQFFDLLAETIVVEREPERRYCIRPSRPILGLLIVLFSMLQIYGRFSNSKPVWHFTPEGVHLSY